MYRPISRNALTYADYFRKADLKLHLIGVCEMIWCTGMSICILSPDLTEHAISCGLSQGTTLMAAPWVVFILKEFNGAAVTSNNLIIAMFLCFMIGLILIILAR